MTPTTPPVKRPALHHLIALTGHAGAGKDTTADLLVAHAGFRRLAFADALRGEVSNAFSVSLDDLDAPHLKNVATVVMRMRLAPRDFLAAVVLSLSAASPNHRTPLSDDGSTEPRSLRPTRSPRRQRVRLEVGQCLPGCSIGPRASSTLQPE